MSPEITYRLFQDEDLPGVLRLWEQESNWGKLTPEVWKQWYRNTPLGNALIAVAQDGQGEIAGQGIFFPTPMIIDGRSALALRMSSPILRQDLRRSSLLTVDHPVVRLYLTGAGSEEARKYDVVFGLPDHGWLPFFKRAANFGMPAFEPAEYRCVELTLPESVTPRAESGGLNATPVTGFGDEYQGLWQAAKKSFPIQCGVERSQAWFAYKNGKCLTLAMYEPDDQSLVGYVSIALQTGLVMDVLVRRPELLTAVLGAAIDHLTMQRSSGAEGIPRVVKAMQTPPLRSSLEAVGFKPVDYRFAFVCAWRESLPETRTSGAIQPEHWYLMAGD
jgi:hypothetical protein